MRLISLRDGGIFSNDKYRDVGVASNTFIFQDDNVISVINVEKRTAKLIRKVKGLKNHGIFIEKR